MIISSKQAAVRLRLFCSLFIVLSLLAWPHPVLADPLTPRLVKDINPLTADAKPGKLTAARGTLYFLATTPENGEELWRSDGTANGTALVRDIKVGPEGVNIDELVEMSGTLFFNIHYKQDAALWKVTSPAATADQVLKVTHTSTDSVDSLYDLTPVNNTLFFFHQHRAVTAQTYELWTTDGTKTHTQRVATLPVEKHASNLVDLKGIAYFSAGSLDGAGTAFWKSDGTAPGTVQIKPLKFGSDTSDNAWPLAVKSRIYFVASDGSDGYELFKSDGTDANTKRIANINLNAGSNPTGLTELNSKLYFSADDGIHGQELWTSDGTEAGTGLLKDINPNVASAQPHDFVMLNNTLYFAADDGSHGTELWKSDGTPANTLLVKDVISGTQGSTPSQLTIWNNALYFVANNAKGGIDLWQSDGSAAGTVSVMPVTPALVGQAPFTPTLAAVGSELFFPAYTTDTGIELWVMGGCPEGCHVFLPLIGK